MHIHVWASPSMLCPTLWMEPGWSNATNIIPVTAHPCSILLLADGALVGRARGSHRADRDAPNESSVAQLRTELWPETCFGWMCIPNVKAASMVFSELWMIIHGCIKGLVYSVVCPVGFLRVREGTLATYEISVFGAVGASSSSCQKEYHETGRRCPNTTKS